MKKQAGAARKAALYRQTTAPCMAQLAGLLVLTAQQRHATIGTSQQQGLNSRGFKGCILPGQEKRVQRFHERLNDFVLNKD